MATPAVRRKLAAILAADIVGYSRLMGVDETGTLRAVKALQKGLVEPLVARYRGRIVKLTGDGILVEFASAVDAVLAAVALQRAMAARNAAIPDDRRLAYRVGINIGDVIVEGDDIFGDGVNVAARLEGIAEAGGICLSQEVWKQVKGKVDVAVRDLGEQQLKNIAEPVQVYSVTIDGNPSFGDGVEGATLPAPSNISATYRIGAGILGAVAVFIAFVAGLVWLAMVLAPPSPAARVPRLSIVVLPFTNLSGDPAQDYLADVITDELTTGLSRIGGTFVIARTTAFTYKGKALDVKQIGRELGVRYVLEGSAQKSGNRVRLNAQLIDASSGAHLWADEFDADSANQLQMQDEIVSRLARALEVQLTVVDAARSKKTPPANLDAEDLASRCMANGWDAPVFSPEQNAAFDFCERALLLDKSNVRALIGVAYKYLLRVVYGQSGDVEADVRRMDELASRALAIDPDAYAAHMIKAYVLLFQKRAPEAIAEGERSIELNPSYIEGYVALEDANNYLGRPERTIEYADKAIRLSPRDPHLPFQYEEKGTAYFMLRRDDEAIEWLRRSAAGVANSPVSQLLLVSALVETGHEPEARETLQRYLSLPAAGIKTVAEWQAFWDAGSLYISKAAIDRVSEALRKIGLPEA